MFELTEGVDHDEFVDSATKVSGPEFEDSLKSRGADGSEAMCRGITKVDPCSYWISSFGARVAGDTAWGVSSAARVTCDGCEVVDVTVVESGVVGCTVV